MWFIIPAIFLLPLLSSGQSHNYWSRSFNEESSLVSGAVVGGGSGPSAIYYNPASISEITQSKFTLNASLFSFDFITIKNGLGDGIDINSNKGIIKPRFISYMINMKKYPNWSFEIAYLNNENTRIDLTESVDRQMDILTHVQGNERYLAVYQASNYYRDDWIGMGGSVKINQKIYFGLAFFVTIKGSDKTNLLSIDAIPLSDSILIDSLFVPFYSASYSQYSYTKYNDYRILGKAGILYKRSSFSAGLSITTPSLGVYSDGKRAIRAQKQSNITLPETGQSLPDYVIADYKEKGDVNVSTKTPLSIAAGITYSFHEDKRTVYFSAEYYTGIEPYRLLEADESSEMGYGSFTSIQRFDEWLTIVSGAKPVLNTALGYSWKLNTGLRLMAGFSTDFNYQKNFDYGELQAYLANQNIRIDLYHLTGGLQWKIFGQDITTGIEYHVGRQEDQYQLVNLSDPVEFNTQEMAPLQGNRNNNMNAIYNSVSIYLGASFNFGGETK